MLLSKNYLVNVTGLHCNPKLAHTMVNASNGIPISEKSKTNKMTFVPREDSRSAWVSAQSDQSLLSA